MARTRTTKKLAQRIDLNYFKRPTPLKRSKFWLSLFVPALAIVWIAWRGITNDARVYSSGRLSAAHAVLERECAACHIQQAGTFSAKAADTACLACHDGPVHHATQTGTPPCAVCHTEHRGRINLSAVGNQACARCHADLLNQASIGHYFPKIHDFGDAHPEFRVLNGAVRDPGTIKLNHALHMKTIRRGPSGPDVQLECGDCHRSVAASGPWPYSDAKYIAAKTSLSEQDELLPLRTAVLSSPMPRTGRELMAPVKFATACAACHLLTFDKLFDEGVPHDKPEVIHEFLVRKFTEYIAAHPREVRVVRDPNRDLTGKPLQPEVRVLTPAKWVAERTTEAEELLWRKTCSQCHTLDATAGNPLPSVASPQTTARWMPHAKFDHDAHGGFTCVSCHEKALTSTAASDLLLPGIATCRTCHAPGSDHAESRCFECHTYHDWSKRKEVKPAFTLPAQRRSGR